MILMWNIIADQYISTCVKFDVARYVVTYIKEALKNCGVHPGTGFTIPLHVSEFFREKSVPIGIHLVFHSIFFMIDNISDGGSNFW